MTWDADLLEGYVSTELPLPDAPRMPGEPDDVKVVATLVRRDEPRRSRRAVLYVHGWNDYFFQTHLADEFAARGIDFYAVDLIADLPNVLLETSGGYTSVLSAALDRLVGTAAKRDRCASCG